MKAYCCPDPRAAMVRVAVTLLLFLPLSQATAQGTVLNRLVCPLSMPGAGCMRIQVGLKPVANGEQQLTVILQNLQTAQYPGDPWISSIMSVHLNGPRMGTPPAWGYERPAWVGSYGSLQNSLGTAASTWSFFHDYSNATRSSFGFTSFQNNSWVQSGLGGCTGGTMPTGIPLGYQSCQSTAFGALVLQGVVPAGFAWTAVSDLRVYGLGYDTTTPGAVSWQCDALRVGQYDGPGQIPATRCDVSDATDFLDVGDFTSIVTPEPASVVLLATGLAGGALLRRRRRHLRGSTQRET